MSEPAASDTAVPNPAVTNPAVTNNAQLRALIVEFVRFGMIGTIGFVADSGTLLLVEHGFGLNPYGAKVISYLVAATVTWALNRRFTFKQAREASAFRQWLIFLGANALGGLANYATFAGLVTFVPFAAANQVAANAAGAIAGLMFNFTINKFWVFRLRV